MKIWKSVIDIILKQSKTTSSHKPVPELKVEPLESRTLLASHPLVDAPDIDYKIPEDWDTGHTGEFSLINDEGVDFENWQIEFDYGAAIGNYWNAELESLGNGRYRLTPPSWDNTLNQGENLAIGFIAYGSTSTPSNITFNGVPAGPPDPDTDSSSDTNPTDSGTTDSGTTDDSSSTDPAQLPTIQISGAQVVEGDTGHVTATFTVTLSEASNETVTADFHTMTNSAASGIDFEQAAGTVSFAPGETTQTIDVLVKGDLLVESDERFEVMLMNPVGGVFEGSDDMHAGHGMVSGGSPGEVLSVPTEGAFSYFSDSGSNSFRIMDLTSTGAHNVQLMVNSSGDLMVIGPFNGSAIQQHETRLEQLIADTTVSFLETRLPDPEEDPNSMISGWMQDPIGGLQISNAHLYCDAAGLFLGEKLGVVGGQSDVGFVVTSHRMNDYGTPIVNVIENFDPSSDKLDFQYFANREFAVADTPDGLLISASPQASDPWGEKTLILGVTFSELSEDNFIFRFEQKYEDGFNRFGGTSETTPTDGSREIPFVASPLDPTNSQTTDGTTSIGEFTVNITDDWGTGYVSQVNFAPEVTVGTWQVTLEIDGAIQNIWNAEILSQQNGRYVIGNVDYNGNVSAGQTTSFGFDATGSSSSIQIVSDIPDDNPMPDDDMSHDDNHTGIGAISGYGTIIDNDTDTPPMDDHSGHDGNDDSTAPPMDDHDHGSHDPMEPPASSGDYIDITSWGTFHDSNHNSEHDELVGGRTAITTEAHEAYNNLRAFLGLSPVTMEEVGEWAFSESLTNNSQAWGNDLLGVGLWYAMQGAKVGWISDGAYDPQILADIQRTARTVEDPTAMRDQVMDMVRQYGHEGYADYLEQYGIVDTFINTLKMEPHYGGWMHGRTHGFRSIEGVAINHDVNHLTVLSWDQMQPFMNDTFDWPQWDALDVSDSGVIEYFQSMVSLGNPVGQNLESAPTSIAPPVTDPPTTPPVDDNSDTTDSGNTDSGNSDSGTTDSGTTDTDNSVDAPKMVAYFPEWGIYGRDYHISDIPASELTHLVYAFANLTADGQMVLYDSYAATEKRFAAGDTVTGEADLWHYPEDDPRSAQTVWGNFNQIAQLKAENPHLRTSIALGGWTLSTHFSTATSTAAGREALAQSIYDFLNTYTMFDGIDFDWEYPGGGGLSTNSVSSQDGENYAALLELVRDKIDLLGNELGRYYEISVASPAGSDKIVNFNLPGLKDNVDFFNVMTYDLHGTWENTTGHQSALRNDPVGYDIETAINLYLNAGVPQEKIILGNALYTRAWSGVADGGDNGYQEAASGAAPGTFESGTYDYKDLLGQIQTGTSDWELNWDDDAQAAYLYSASQQIFSSFETPGTISLKSEWAQDSGLGGMMFWDLSNDSTGPESLISAAANSWFDGQTFSEITSASDLVFANIYGGNGVFDLVAESATTPSNPTTGSDVTDSTDTSGDDSTNDEVVDPPTSNTNGSLSDGSVTFAKSQSWYNGFNADATIQNPNSTKLTNWVLEFTFDGDITHIWNATILQRDGNRYVVTGADWNRDIYGGGEVSFGFTAAGTELLSPTDVALYSKDLNNDEY